MNLQPRLQRRLLQFTIQILVSQILSNRITFRIYWLHAFRTKFTVNVAVQALRQELNCSRGALGFLSQSVTKLHLSRAIIVMLHVHLQSSSQQKRQANYQLLRFSPLCSSESSLTQFPTSLLSSWWTPSRPIGFNVRDQYPQFCHRLAPFFSSQLRTLLYLTSQNFKVTQGRAFRFV